MVGIVMLLQILRIKFVYLDIKEVLLIIQGLLLYYLLARIIRVNIHIALNVFSIIKLNDKNKGRNF